MIPSCRRRVVAIAILYAAALTAPAQTPPTVRAVVFEGVRVGDARSVKAMGFKAMAKLPGRF